MRRNIAIAAAIIVVGFVSWLGLGRYRKHRACRQRAASLSRQIADIKRDAHTQLTIGAKESTVTRFFAEHGIPFSVSDSMAIGTLRTSGCAPFGCGTDEAIIGVRVKLDNAGAVTEEPTVVSLYTSCL